MFSLVTNHLSDHTCTMETVYTTQSQVTKKNKRIIENETKRTPYKIVKPLANKTVRLNSFSHKVSIGITWQVKLYVLKV